MTQFGRYQSARLFVDRRLSERSICAAVAATVNVADSIHQASQ